MTTRRNERTVAIVTGATAGIGKAIAIELARHGTHVVLACRNDGHGRLVARSIEALSGSPVDVLRVDFADLRSIRTAADDAMARFDRIDALVNNAGVWSQERSESAQGIERTWAVNVLGYHAFTRWLEPILRASAPARVVNIASGLAHSLELDDVELLRRPYRGVTAYAQSKQANRMLTRAFARRLRSADVSVNSMHPGFTRTRAFAKGGGLSGKIAGLGATLFGKSPRRAADTAVWLALEPALDGVSGGYFKDRIELECAYRNANAEDALFELCERMCAA